MIVVVARDLIIVSRIEATAARARQSVVRVDDPTQLPPPNEVDLLLVDWAERRPDWPGVLDAWRAAASRSRVPRVVLFGPHTDLDAHRSARTSGYGPMLARSKLMLDLPNLV